MQSVYEFQKPHFGGYVRPIGHHHGLVLTHGADGQWITKPGLCTFNLEHYCAQGICGPFHPRNTDIQSCETEDERVILRFASTEAWSLDAALEYDLSHDEYIDVLFTFHFHTEYTDFEAFVASYMARRETPFIRIADRSKERWIRPHIYGNRQMFFCKDETSKRMVSDGRWDWLTERGHPACRAEPETYSVPIIVSRDDRTGWALVQLADPKSVFAISPNVFAPAHDWSLVGRDVNQGETVPCRFRVHYVQVADMADVMKLYESFLADLS